LSGGWVVDGSTRSMNAFGFMDNNAMNYWYPSSSILNSPTNSIIANNFYITEFFMIKMLLSIDLSI
jgi:hypothetical protein